jgi:signal transduction histidine kinase
MRRGWQRLTLRARLLVIGVLGVAVALAIGSLVLYGVLSVASYRTLDASSRATGADVAALIADGRLPDPIPVTGNQIVQVVDARNRVVSASVNADRLAPLLSPGELRRALAGSPPLVTGSRVGLSSPLRVIAVPAGRADPRTVVVAQQVQDIRHSQDILKIALLLTYPILLAALAVIAWRVVGAALRPVEALRSSADRISGSAQGDRLPVPTSGDEISALAVTLNSMLDRLAASRAHQRSFIADAAHELRSPLASMQTQLDVADRLGEQSPLTEDLRAEVTRMSQLVEDLLVLARLDADTAPHRAPEAVPVLPVVDDVVQHYPGVRVRPSPPGPDGLAVRCRRDELRRALSNLTHNAVRHAVHTVEVGVEVEGRVVVISVRDDGAGIAVEDRDRVFERFTRLDEGRARDAGGSGLGLAIVRELMARNGGEVRLGDAPGQGLEAQLRLPRA